MEKIVESALPQVIVAQLGARRHYAVPVILHHAGMLAHFYTDIFLSPIDQKLSNLPFLSRHPAVQRSRGRFAPELPSQRVTSFPRFGLTLALKHMMAGADIVKEHQVHLWAGENFAREVIRKGFGKANIIYNILGEGLGIAAHPSAADLFKVADVAIAPHWYLLILEEHQRWPGWENGIEGGRLREMAQLDQQNMLVHSGYSDLLLCCSEFVKDSVIALGGPAERCVLVPFGYASRNVSPEGQAQTDDNQALRVLYVGRVELRKGIQYINEAMRLLKSTKISVEAVGSIGMSAEGLGTLQQYITLRGQVPRSEVPDFYQQADIFVFPSICEGSALVCYEAMAAGLPVITTLNAGSVVRDGIDGFIVPIRDPEALAEKIDLLARDRDLRHWMSQNARKRAQEFTLEKYGERLVEALLTHWKGIRKGGTLQ